MQKKLIYTTVGLVSFATIIFELLQTRILSFIFFPHMVYLTIAIAMLGFGISGSLVAVFASQMKHRRATLGNLLIAFAITTIVAILATMAHILVSGHLSLVKTLFLFAMYLFPFVSAGAILSICLAASEYDIGKLYAIDLLSAGLACVVFAIFLPVLNPTRLIGFIVFSMSLLAFFWAEPSSKWVKANSVVFTILGFIAMILGTELPIFPDGQKELNAYLVSPAARIERIIWTPICRVDLLQLNGSVDGKSCWNHWHDLPPRLFKVITQDGAANTRLYSSAAISLMWERMHHSSTFPGMALAFPLKDKPDVAIIGTGGGLDIINALGLGAKSVLAGELNPAIYDFLARQDVDYTGHIFENPKVKIVNEEGRSMLRQHCKKFDVIHMYGTDTFAALSTGAYVLSENYLYTVEAFREMLGHLKEGGILSVVRWHFWNPPRESLRVVSLACEAMKCAGQTKDIEKQVCVVEFNNWATCLFKNSSFTKTELEKIIQLATENHFNVLYFPKIFPPDQQYKQESAYYKLASAKVLTSSRIFNELVAAYVNGKEEQFFYHYPYRVDPTTDDSPFFYEYHSRNNTGSCSLNEVHGTNAAGMTLYTVLGESLVFMLLAICWPLWKYKQKGLSVPHTGSFSVYFAAIGIGFMMIEIGLIQKVFFFSVIRCTHYQLFWLHYLLAQV